MFEPLFKRTSTGAVQVWQIRVVCEDDGSGTIITTHGQVDGAMQESRDTVREGKNPGKKNATTPYQQAVKEAEAKWTKQRDRNHYGLTVEESEAKKFVAPMLAQSYTDSKGDVTGYARKVNWSDHGCNYVQPKFDGHRCLAIRDADGTLKLFTRKGVEVTTCQHLIEQLSVFMPTGTTFDGELYIHNTPLSDIGSYIKRQQPMSEQLCYMMYDMVANEPFAMRFQQLSQLATRTGGPQLHLAMTQPVNNLDDVLNFQAQCLENNYEGAMLRHGRDGYEPGVRSGSLIKVKTFVDGEFTIVGCREGRAKFEGAAIFECVTAAGHKFEVTAPGDMPQKQWYWQNHQSFIGKSLTVKYQKMTATAEPVPFLPVAKGIAG